MSIKLFAKFGQKDHLEGFQKDGLLYSNTITYFSNLEDNNMRGDKYESVVELAYSENSIFSFKPADDPLAEVKTMHLKNSLVKKSIDKPRGNIFCMSALGLSPTTKQFEYKLDEKFSGYGYFLLILRYDLFMERLTNSLKTLQFTTCYDYVQYLDLGKHSGKKSLFQKDNEYSWQEEFRIVFHSEKFEEDDPFQFSIGSIEDISAIYRFEDAKTLYFELQENPYGHEKFRARS
jgi:hypothetical protein